jgi:aromatic ring-opening dioxygenase catalytic subunit (LigB family)
MGDMFAPMADYLASIPQWLGRTPSAILVVTAHWEAEQATVTSHEKPSLIFDYYGFPAETYHLTYPAPGDPALASRVAGLLADTGIKVRVDPEYGWDHGVFIPLKVIYPQADIPVVAMSLVSGLDPARHLEIGRALRPLAEEGVLILGSGMSYHNLSNLNGPVPSTQFHRWLDEALSGDAEHRSANLEKWAAAPSARASHPREEHLLPLMVCSGAGTDRPAIRTWAGQMADTPVGAWAFP